MTDPISPLKLMLNPAFLRSLVAARVPFDRHAPLDFSEVGRVLFSDISFSSEMRENNVAFPILKAISKLGLDSVPDMMEFLPEPSSKDFPELCLGLIVLLDQVTRVLFEGIDKRWETEYFDVISQRFAARWRTLPPDLRPDLWHRWNYTTGTSFDYWVATRMWFVAPNVHSEAAKDHEFALSYTNDTRAVVELVTGQRDPHRARRSEILSDVYAFPFVAQEGAPQGPHVTLAFWTFWMCMLMDIHKPIIDRFHRYPYKNSGLGRKSSEEEKDWLDKTDHFAEASPEVAKRIKEDIEAGRWTPLGEGSSYLK
ncbi:hypothetical protein TARUN_5937 [Trichoderma arundinaceum]|uniref:Uncharacterized protein n=1 Tax=Trichoderma arundinaceum TaxID=490622 RepID=A0A395NK57_TRIAR|nr:hypothetical protein TARUN_5937 [Trichoderma arundinaceum]